jgi:hypothetical protein
VSGFYLLGGERDLVPMVEEPYLAESDLQKLLAEYPTLLSGDRGHAERRWLLVTREVPLPSEEGGPRRWSLDHLFLDNEGVPTLVEVKRSSDTRIRREVIGQLLDYAANGVTFWPPDALRGNLQERCEREGVSEEDAIRELVGREDPDLEEFWAGVATNLKAGRVRLVFVADEIPPELKRVIEFLNEQMNPAEVFGIEVKQFSSGALKTLAARTIGVTEQAREQRRVRPARGSQREWDEESFFSDLAERRGPDAVEVARRILNWALSKKYVIRWRGGTVDGRARLVKRVITSGGSKVWSPFYIWTYGTVEIQFELLKSRPPFDDPRMREEFLGRLRKVAGAAFKENAIDARPPIPLSLLESDESFEAFAAAIDWFTSVIEAEAN